MSNKLYIPIGIDCSASHYLRSTGQRNEAFPFDWNITPISSALKLIENNFEGFLELGSLEFLPPTYRLLFRENGVDVKITKDIITPVICHRYGILFPHDFSESGVKDYKYVKDKYERRILRLMDIIKSPSKKIFLYNLGVLNDWQLEQYKYAHCTFIENSRDEVKSCFSKLSYNNIELASVKELKNRDQHINKVKSLFRFIRNKIREQVA